jgi:hypothetical protein
MKMIHRIAVAFSILLVPAAATVAAAADLVTSMTLGGSFGCVVNNTSTTKDITVSVWVKNASGVTLSGCEDEPVAPEKGVVCPSRGNELAYCRVATTSPASTRAALLSINGGEVTAVVEAR